MAPGLEPFAEIIKHRYCTVKWIASFRTEFNDIHQRLIELYLGDGISLEQFLRKIDQNMNREADELIEMHTRKEARDFWDYSDPKWGKRWNRPGPTEPGRCPPSCR